MGTPGVGAGVAVVQSGCGLAKNVRKLGVRTGLELERPLLEPLQGGVRSPS